MGRDIYDINSCQLTFYGLACIPPKRNGWQQIYIIPASVVARATASFYLMCNHPISFYHTMSYMSHITSSKVPDFLPGHLLNGRIACVTRYVPSKQLKRGSLLYLRDRASFFPGSRSRRRRRRRKFVHCLRKDFYRYHGEIQINISAGHQSSG